jgi:hypothetical protein
LIHETSAPRIASGVPKTNATGMPPVCLRLLPLKDTAQYLGVSIWQVRGMVHAGILRPVRLPVGPGAELRRHVFDIHDLDQLIERAKT